MPSLPLVLVAPPGATRDQFLGAFPGPPPAIFDSVNEFWAGRGEEWGVLILGPGHSPEESLAFLAQEAGEDIPWAALLAFEEGDAFTLRPISLGQPVGTEKVQEIRADPDEKGPLLELHWVLRVVAKARHDLNNPLTSGLAEAQLLLMDEHPQDVVESLETIQEQYRRLRDMVADLSRLRVQKPSF